MTEKLLFVRLGSVFSVHLDILNELVCLTGTCLTTTHRAQCNPVTVKCD